MEKVEIFENLDQTTRDKDNINNSVQNYLKKNNEINNINNLNINGNVNNEENSNFNSKTNTNADNSNNNLDSYIIPESEDVKKNSFLKHIKINSSSVSDCNNSKKKKSPNSTESLENSNLENVYSSNINRDQKNGNDKETNSDQHSNSRSHRDSIDSKNMDIDEFIHKISLQETQNYPSIGDTEIERKNEPFLISTKSTNFSEKNNKIIYQASTNINFESDNQSKNKEQAFSALFKFRSLRYKFLICCLLWFVTSFTYYGMSFFLKKGGENVFTNGYVIYLAEGISYFFTGIIMSVSFLGRVRSLSIMMILAGISTLVFWFIKDISGMYDKIPLFIARFSITSIYSIMYTYSTEVYPTSIRAKGLGLNTFCARISSIMVPIIVELVDNPFVIFSVMMFISFFFTFSLPETNNKELEDEILEVIIYVNYFILHIFYKKELRKLYM